MKADSVLFIIKKSLQFAVKTALAACALGIVLIVVPIGLVWLHITKNSKPEDNF